MHALWTCAHAQTNLNRNFEGEHNRNWTKNCPDKKEEEENET